MFFAKTFFLANLHYVNTLATKMFFMDFNNIVRELSNKPFDDRSIMSHVSPSSMSWHYWQQLGSKTMSKIRLPFIAKEILY